MCNYGSVFEWQRVPRSVMELRGCRDGRSVSRILIRLRWPEGFSCPRCSGTETWPIRAVYFNAGVASTQASVTAARSSGYSDALTVCFARYVVTREKRGQRPACRVLGLKSYETLGLGYTSSPSMIRPAANFLAKSGS